MITVMASVMIVQAALIYQVQHKTSIARKHTQCKQVPSDWALTLSTRCGRYWRRRYAIHLPRSFHNRLPSHCLGKFPGVQPEVMSENYTDLNTSRCRYTHLKSCLSRLARRGLPFLLRQTGYAISSSCTLLLRLSATLAGGHILSSRS